MNRSNIVFYVILLLFSCHSEDRSMHDFFWSYQNYIKRPIDDTKLMSAYSKVSERLNEEYMRQLKGTHINVICSFMSDYRKSKFNLSSSQIKKINKDFDTVKTFLYTTKNAGSIYRECVEPFGLSVNKNWRYE
jgi:hypothetical protein